MTPGGLLLQPQASSLRRRIQSALVETALFPSNWPMEEAPAVGPNPNSAVSCWAGGWIIFKPTTASGQPIILNPTEQGAGALTQGMLEASNVNVVEELVTMIETQRAYEVNSKAISAVDSMLRFLNNNL